MQNHVLYAHVCNASCTSVFGCICMTVFYAHVSEAVIRLCSSVNNYVRYTVHKMCSCLGYYVHLQYTHAHTHTYTRSRARAHTHTVDHYILYNQYEYRGSACT